MKNYLVLTAIFCLAGFTLSDAGITFNSVYFWLFMVLMGMASLEGGVITTRRFAKELETELVILKRCIASAPSTSDTQNKDTPC